MCRERRALCVAIGEQVGSTENRGVLGKLCSPFVDRSRRVLQLLEHRSGESLICPTGSGRMLEPKQLMFEIAPSERIETQRLLGCKPVARLPERIDVAGDRYSRAGRCRRCVGQPL